MAQLQQSLWRNLGFWAHLHFTGRLKPHWSLELYRDLLNEYLERHQGAVVLKLFRKVKKEGSVAR